MFSQDFALQKRKTHFIAERHELMWIAAMNIDVLHAGRRNRVTDLELLENLHDALPSDRLEVGWEPVFFQKGHEEGAIIFSLSRRLLR